MAAPTLDPAVFFDRDGVLNHDLDFIYRPADFVWNDGAKEAIKWCNDHGYRVIVVTNQSGIARGYYKEADFQGLVRWIDGELTAVGAHIDATYFCPHHPEAPLVEYRAECRCRKPQAGMIEDAIREWNIDRAASILIGDHERDLEAAAKAGIAGFLYREGNLKDFLLSALHAHSGLRLGG